MVDSKLKFVQEYVAGRYLNLEKPGEYSPEQSVKALHEDFEKFISSGQLERGYAAWISCQMLGLAIKGFDRLYCKKTFALTPAELSAIVDFGLHMHFGSLQVAMPWPEVQNIMSAQIDESQVVANIDSKYLPNSLWIGLAGKPSEGIPTWKRKIVGVMLTRIPLHEVHKDDILICIKTLPQWEHLFEMLSILCDCEGNHFAYTANVVRKEDAGFSFLSTVFGHDEAATIADMILLHREITQKRKTKDIERFAAELCIRSITTGKTSREVSAT